MTAEETYQILKQFFETRPVVATALAPLQSGVEIALEVAGLPMTLKKSTDGKLELLQREAQKPDVAFSFDALTAQRLAQEKSEDIGDWGILIFREILAGHIRARFPGPIWNILRRGYIPVVMSGGSRLRGWMAEHGYIDITKIVRKLKRE